MEQSEVVRQLKDLAALHESGAITDNEFATAKARVLDRQRQGGVPPAPAPGPAPPDSGGWHPLPQPEPGGWNTPPLLMPPRRPAPAPVLTGRWAGHGGAITAAVGGLITLLAFLAMPMATVPFLGSITGASLVGYASEDPELGLLLLIPLVAVNVVAFAAGPLFGRPRSARGRRSGAIKVMVGSGLIVLFCFIGFVRLQVLLGDSGASLFGVSATSVLGAGFWLILIGMLAAGIGGYRELLAADRGGTASPSDPSSDSSGFLPS